MFRINLLDEDKMNKKNPGMRPGFFATLDHYSGSCGKAGAPGH